uniref:Uncharacterized protein n=1 Tax=Avena sativa TaxID=4498 RepID=A0ACD6AWI7_AVESA
MVREEVAGSTQTLQWKCVESRVDSKRLYYGRFILSPLKKGQADTVGIALRRALLGEIEGACITRAKSGSVPHEYSTIAGIEESVQEILLNLKEIVLRSNLYGVRDASICVKGPRRPYDGDGMSSPNPDDSRTPFQDISNTHSLDPKELKRQRNREYYARNKDDILKRRRQARENKQASATLLNDAQDVPHTPLITPICKNELHLRAFKIKIVWALMA